MSSIVVALLKIKPGTKAEFEAAAQAAVEGTHAEAGCHVYAWHRVTDDPTQYVVVEKWSDLDALEAHGTAAHMTTFREAVGPLLEERTVLVTEPVPFGDPVKGAL